MSTIEIRQEIARLERLLAENLRKRYAAETPNRSRFAYASHITKLNNKIARLTRELEERER